MITDRQSETQEEVGKETVSVCRMKMAGKAEGDTIETYDSLMTKHKQVTAVSFSC